MALQPLSCSSEMVKQGSGGLCRGRPRQVPRPHSWKWRHRSLTSGCVRPKDVLSPPPVTQATLLAQPLPTAPASGPARAAWRAQGLSESTAVDQMRPKCWPFTPPEEVPAFSKGKCTTGIWTERAPGVCLSHRGLTGIPERNGPPTDPAPGLACHSTPRTRL